MNVGGRTALVSPEYRAQRPTPGTVIPTERELRRALGSIPDDMSWEWAEPRLTPLFERADASGIDGDPAINAVAELGVAIGFGVEMGPTFVRVTRSMAQRWEASLEQIEAAAFRHLEDIAQRISRKDLQHAVHHGHMMRALPEPGGWASSVILAGEATVARIFGSHDQVFTVPSRNVLLAFDEKVPDHVIADVTTGLEELDPHPLLLDPFVLNAGRLAWTGLAGGLEGEAIL